MIKHLGGRLCSSADIYLFIFSEKRKKNARKKKINQALEMRQRRLQADRCLVTHAVTKNLNVRPEEMRRTPSQVDQVLCSTCVTAVEMQVIGRTVGIQSPIICCGLTFEKLLLPTKNVAVSYVRGKSTFMVGAAA